MRSFIDFLITLFELAMNGTPQHDAAPQVETKLDKARKRRAAERMERDAKGAGKR